MCPGGYEIERHFLMLFAMLRLLPPRRGVDRLTADVHAGFQAVRYLGTLCGMLLLVFRASVQRIYFRNSGRRGT